MNECGLDLTFNIIFILTFCCYFQYLLFFTVEKRNKNKQKMGFVEYFFAGLIFAKRGEIRKNKYRKNLYRKILSRIN